MIVNHVAKYAYKEIAYKGSRIYKKSFEGDVSESRDGALVVN